MSSSGSTTSGLALVPLPMSSTYRASKAALHSFILFLREQLKASKIKVVELFPPLVQSTFAPPTMRDTSRGSRKAKCWECQSKNSPKRRIKAWQPAKSKSPLERPKGTLTASKFRGNKLFRVLIKSISGTYLAS